MDKGRIVHDGESAALRADPEYLARLFGAAWRRSGARDPEIPRIGGTAAA
jgi:hypothetical protein